MRCQITVGLLLFSFLAVRAGEMTEADKRVEFAKAIASAKPEERIAAVQLLKGAKEGASFLFLTRVAATDLEEAVRLTAYNQLMEWEDKEGKLSNVVLDIYRNEKSRSARIAMAQTFPTLKIKTGATEEAVKLLFTLLYPETFDGNNNGGGNRNRDNSGSGFGARQRSAEQIAALRKEYTDVLSVVNTLTGQSFAAGPKAKEEAKKWWALHKTDFMKADAEMLVKLRDEAQAAATKQQQ